MSFQQLFIASKGKPIEYNGLTLIMAEKIKLIKPITKIKAKFLSTKSNYLQGFVLRTKGQFEFLIDNEKAANAIVLWENTAPKEIEINVHTKTQELIIYNVWDTGDGTTQAWYNGGAMYLKKENNKTIFYCNDGHPNDDFDDLIFSIELA